MKQREQLKRVLKGKYREFVASVREMHRNKSNDSSIAGQIEILYTSEIPIESIICVFAHYNETKVKKNTLDYLKVLHNNGVSIIFVSTNKAINETDLQLLQKYCRIIIRRSNIGYDFYSYKVGLSVFGGYSNHPMLILANDSVFVNIKKLCSFLSWVLSQNADVIGATDCYKYHYHYQSYFVAIKKVILQTQQFQSFWIKKVKIFHEKLVIVKKLEVGLSKMLLKTNTAVSFISAKEVFINYSKRKSLNRYNVTIDSWKELIDIFHFPFVKRELVEKRKSITWDNLKGILIE